MQIFFSVVSVVSVLKKETIKRCDNCRFSIWMMSANRPKLACCQKANFAGQWWVVTLDDSCPNFYPSKDYTLGFPNGRSIPITQGKFALVDADDYYQLSKYNWCANGPDKTKLYATRKRNGKYFKMHREITDAPEGLFVDHIDHNGLNNCRSNLRLCTQAQNNLNATSKRGRSNYKGVFWKRKSKKWGAAIQLNRKMYHIGLFTDEIEAAKAYDKRASLLHGEFACLNFPPAKQCNKQHDSRSAAAQAAR
jgi:hypothetical protein